MKKGLWIDRVRASVLAAPGQQGHYQQPKQPPQKRNHSDRPKKHSFADAAEGQGFPNPGSTRHLFFFFNVVGPSKYPQIGVYRVPN